MKVIQIQEVKSVADGQCELAIKGIKSCKSLRELFCEDEVTIEFERNWFEWFPENLRCFF